MFSITIFDSLISHPMSLLAEFSTFLDEYGVIGLAIAFVIGLAVTQLVSAIVDDIIMPIVAVFLPGGGWQSAVLIIGSIEFQVGHFLSALIDFLLIAFLIFLFVRYALPTQEEEAE